MDKAAFRLRVRNLYNYLHFNIAGTGISRTHFQADTFPEPFRSNITVTHDGIKTEIVAKNAEPSLTPSEHVTLPPADEIGTLINRNLEPYRGYHTFMRALPQLLKERPKAQIVLIWGDGVSYGAPAPKGKTWKQIFLDEVKDNISEQGWQTVDYIGCLPYDTYLSTL